MARTTRFFADATVMAYLHAGSSRIASLAPLYEVANAIFWTCPTSGWRVASADPPLEMKIQPLRGLIKLWTLAESSGPAIERSSVTKLLSRRAPSGPFGNCSTAGHCTAAVAGEPIV